MTLVVFLSLVFVTFPSIWSYEQPLQLSYFQHYQHMVLLANISISPSVPILVCLWCVRSSDNLRVQFFSKSLIRFPSLRWSSKFHIHGGRLMLSMLSANFHRHVHISLDGLCQWRCTYSNHDLSFLIRSCAICYRCSKLLNPCQNILCFPAHIYCYVIAGSHPYHLAFSLYWCACQTSLYSRQLYLSGRSVL